MSHQSPAAANILKILVLLHSFEPGGVERVALRLGAGWQDSGADVTVLMGRMDGAMRASAPRLNYVNFSSGRISTKPIETLWMILSAWRWIRRDPPDVIFCAGNTYTIVTAVLRLMLASKCPAIVSKVSNSLHRPDMPLPLRKGYELWLRCQRPLADRWVAMGEALRSDIATFIRIAPEEIAVVDDPAVSLAELQHLADTRDFRRFRSRRGRLFVSVGRLAPQKRFDLLIRAFANGARSGDRLIILGDGPERRKLGSQIRALGLVGRVKMVGHWGDVSKWLARSDHLLLASDYEGVPAVIVEALGAGVPIVTTRCSPWLSEVFGNGRFGQLVARGDEKALASAIRRSGGSKFSLIEARTMAERHAVEHAAPAYLAILANAAAGRARAALTAQIRPPTAFAPSPGRALLDME